jgi:hypothetical protein
MLHTRRERKVKPEPHANFFQVQPASEPSPWRGCPQRSLVRLADPEVDPNPRVHQGRSDASGGLLLGGACDRGGDHRHPVPPSGALGPRHRGRPGHRHHRHLFAQQTPTGAHRHAEKCAGQERCQLH